MQLKSKYRTGNPFGGKEDDVFKPIVDINLFKNIKKIKKKYIVCCGSILPRKNQLNMIKLIMEINNG